FKTLTYLQPNSKVLDIGSGIGRIAIPLSGFLTTEGQYCGFDAVEQGVVWCQENIGKQHPNFDFKYINLFNDLYKSAGIEAASFVFPYHDNAFDMACAISVFTHLLPEETLNYLEQTYRVLAKDGYLVATFFLLNDESRRQMEQESTFNFRYYFGNYSLMDKQVKAANVAYNEDFLLEAIQKIGFTHSTTIRGYWCGNNKGNDNDFQDILVLRK
ncbi:MAG TPA: class I SAM-dependent methyltransferase, partial [Chitinophagales bacterium]|nr:class I SAM-dependent methyltransferase [Chitinophagales bacterium]